MSKLEYSKQEIEAEHERGIDGKPSTTGTNSLMIVAFLSSKHLPSC